MTNLDKILEAVRHRLIAAKTADDASSVAERARAVRSDSMPNRLREAMGRKDRVNVIAEIKRASPSKGVINDLVDPEATARLYERGGACAVSVLTETDFFQGSIDDLRLVRKAVSLPILRKDFIVDEFQIYEAAVAGADAILLIVAALDPEQLIAFQTLAYELEMDALVEVHTREELAIAKDIGAKLIGVNNRNLRTLEVSLEVSRELIEDAPANALMIAESGLTNRSDLVELRSLGYSGFLIGETLMRSADPEAQIKAWTAAAGGE